jgi:hypothetical protein
MDDTLTAIYEHAAAELLPYIDRPHSDIAQAEFCDRLSKALVGAAEVGAREPEPPTSVVRHVQDAGPGSIGIDVEDLAKGGHKITVAVRYPLKDRESWDEAAERVASIARVAYLNARAQFPQAAPS